MKVIALVICFMMMSVAVFASDTGGSNYEYTGYDRLLRHDHNYSQTSSYKAPLGVGVDLTVYEIDVKGLG